ncbi:MAG: hypothetical protein JWN28_266 [Candidatus Saccharibacteria bacterium]|nr:hypothetical protein [Candidatus Saccharibacteria bacterium]
MVRHQATDIKRLRYVLYVRKSTEDENRQVRSIDDQIKDCQRLAKDLDLNVVEVLKETKSAKLPNQRPVFNQMIKALEDKKYDAILCWHPDRLSRNMLEGGYIINMLDERTLQDIRFHSHQFSNDANGKMLLGMLFVFSKQYSDDLSDKVNRGVSGNLDEGKSAGTPKWGYNRSEVSGLYEPNGHHELVKQAWQMRYQGESLSGITQFLKDRGVKRITKDVRRRREIHPILTTVSKMFRDPFYYGILLQANQTVNLVELHGLQAVATKEMYEAIQAMSRGRTRDRNTKKRVTFYPLHAFVYCAVCKGPNHMIVGKNKNGSGKSVLSYRCNNRDCTRKPRSIRAKHIFRSLYEYLETITISDEMYERYGKAIDDMTDEKIIKIKEEVYSLNGSLNHIKSEINERTLAIGRFDEGSPVFVSSMKRLEDLSNDQMSLEAQIAKHNKKIENPSRIKLNKEEFLNLLKTAKDKMVAGSAVEKDALCRILFLNLRVDNEKIVDYLWREPFNDLVGSSLLNSGGAG